MSHKEAELLDTLDIAERLVLELEGFEKLSADDVEKISFW